MSIRKYVISFASFLIAIFSFAGGLKFQQNKGQWQSAVKYRANLINGSRLYIERNQITFNLLKEADIERIDKIHHCEIKNPTPQDLIIHGFAYQMQFIHPNENHEIIPQNKFSDYTNYFIGKNPKKWAGDVNQYGKIIYKNIYQGIDFELFSNYQYIEYSYTVRAGANPNKIHWKYNGIENCHIDSGKLILPTSIGDVYEMNLKAYQNIGGQMVDVPCKFALRGGVLGFTFPKGYNKTQTLIIDPIIVFSTYTGSTSDNWGYTATYDKEGNAYAGGICFGTGYPTTTGAYQTTFAGGNSTYKEDIVLTKFNPTGTNLIYSTYLGGSHNESPHSLVVDSSNHLIVMGTTASLDFPVTSNAYDTTFNSTDSVMSPYGEINYIPGSDIFIAKFTPNGSNLVGCTYIGGTGENGLNEATGLRVNYGDDFRGEVIIDNSGNILAASTTTSTDFPTTPGAAQPNSGGGQDGVAFKLDSTLSNLIWSTYIGGSADDAAYSIQESPAGIPYVTGGTKSTDFPTTSNVIDSTANGDVDGFVVELNPSGTQFLASTYIGTSAYDQSYFVQTNLAGDVYVLGQTKGNFPISSSNLYSNPNSCQFIQKMTPNLDSVLFSTVIGSGTGNINISPTAFLVDNCGHIYLAGWGGYINQSYGNAPNCSVSGMPITANAVKSTTSGSDFYLAVLDDSAQNLLYGTYFGSSTSNFAHVDGGTSRFDKRGYVYEAACAGCGGNSSFPTTPGVWSTTNNGPNCNLAIFKLNLSSLIADIGASVPPKVCVGTSVFFNNNTTTGTNYHWDFGDGTSSNLFQPTHIFSDTGTYNIVLSVTDTLFCSPPAEDSVQIHVVPYPTIAVSNDTSICRGDSIQIEAYSQDSIYWLSSSTISSTSSETPEVYPDSDTIYAVVASNFCGTDTAYVSVHIFKDSTHIINDTAICLGQSITLWASGGTNYSWSPATGLSNPTISSPVASPNSTTNYQVTITDSNTCTWTKNVELFVDTNLPHAYVNPQDTLICLGDSAKLFGSGNHFFYWTPSNLVDNPDSENISAFPTTDTYFVLKATNGCGSDYDSALVRVEKVMPIVSNDTNICIKSNIIYLWAGGGADYFWSPSQYVLDGMDSDIVKVKVIRPTYFKVKIIDTLGCYAYDSVFVDTTVVPWLNVDLGATINFWEKTQLHAYTTIPGSIHWLPNGNLSCDTCFDPFAHPQTTTDYIATFTDTNGCQISDTVQVIVRGNLYVPNTFTPDTDGRNDVFRAYGFNIKRFKMYIFNRWGQLIFTSDNIDDGWNGVYKGEISPVGVYVWKINYSDDAGMQKTMIGNVNLIR